MRTDEERVQFLHRRAKELKRKRDRDRLAVFGSLSASLMVLLVALIRGLSGTLRPIVGGELAGASMLSEGAGGYVLAAVAAFTAGVLVTAVIYYRRKRKGTGQQEAVSQEEKN